MVDHGRSASICARRASEVPASSRLMGADILVNDLEWTSSFTLKKAVCGHVGVTCDTMLITVSCATMHTMLRLRGTA